jgi:hypothetical protein
MTDLTPRQILDAIRRGLEETWRRIDEGALEHMNRYSQSHERTHEFAETGHHDEK